MLIAKQHISGVAVVYPGRRKRVDDEQKEKVGRPQGSLYNQQRRAIADAVEYMRRYAVNKPLIFLLTTPGEAFLELSKEQTFVARFLNNMRTNYDLREYVWVRELTKNGYPHYHFVADVPRFDVLKLSLLWSSYFGSTAKNSIRLGTKPYKNKSGKWVRKFYVDSDSMANYLGKYIGKEISEAEIGTRVRRFAISQKLRKESEPIRYIATIKETVIGTHYPAFELIGDPADWIETEGLLDKNRYKWRKIEHHSVYIGSKRRQKIIRNHTEKARI